MSQDRELEKYLAGNSELSKLYAELPEEKLPVHLDAAILAEAHRAAGARPGAVPKRRWTIPLGMVATLFVAVMIALQLPHMLKDAALPPMPQEGKSSVMMEKSMAERPLNAPEESGKIHEMMKSKSALTRSEPAPMAAAEAPAKPGSPAHAVVVPPAPSATAAAKRMELNRRADMDSRRSLSKEEKAVGHAAGSVSDALEQSMPAATPAPVQLNRALVQPLKDETDTANLPPDDWLTRIKQLQKDGRLDEATKELAAFKKRYPEYPVPVSLEQR